MCEGTQSMEPATGGQKGVFMAIAEQFAGLQMDQLIGAPLRAAADASNQLANSTAEFINRVGFDANGNVQTVAFGYQRRSVNEDGTSNLDEMKVNVPMLAIVPIPNLQVDEVNILFDMEVKQSEKQESSMDMGATVSGTLNLGIVKVSVTGNISTHQSNTRSSDNSAKYHVDVRATNHGIPEGLARVLDMMAANVAPTLVGSSLKDGNGQDLSGQAKLKAERLKGIRQEISQIENRLGAARDGLDNSIRQMKRLGATQLNAFQGRMMKLMNDLEKDNEEDDKTAAAYSQAMDEVNQSWNAFQNQAPDMIRLLVDSNDQSDGVSELLGLRGLSDMGEAEKYSGGDCYQAFVSAQRNSMTAQANVNTIEKELFDKKAEYSDVIAGRAALPESGGYDGSVDTEDPEEY